LLAEHERLRTALGALDVAIELGAARAETLDVFVAPFESHREREEALLYPYAERHLPVTSARSVAARLRGATRRKGEEKTS
jgi:hypothetical protein